MNRSFVLEGLKKYTMVIALILVVMFFTFQTNGALLLPQNINNLIAQNAYVFILATGMLLCILTGGNIDLSVGSVVCLAGAIGGKLMVEKGVNPFVAILVMLVVGTLIGVWQGFWIANVRIPPFIVTLAGMLIFRGLSNVVLGGMTMAPMPESFLVLFNSHLPNIGGGDLNITAILTGVVGVAIYVITHFVSRSSRQKHGYQVENLGVGIVKLSLVSLAVLILSYSLALYKGIPAVLIWVLAIVAIFAYVTNKTVMGRHLYAVGGNEQAAKLSGINTNRVYFMSYVNMGILAAVAGMVTVARLNSANPTAGNMYELDAIGACFIGGASAYGGTGKVSGVIVGATLMGVINLGMSLMGVDANWQKVVKGGVLLAAVIFDVMSKKRSK